MTQTTKGNVLDKVIFFFSPAAGVKRMYARSMAQRFFATGYEAGAMGGRLGNWGFYNKGPNTEYVWALPFMRERSRDLIRNNPWALKAVNVIVANTVGTGIVTRPKATNSNMQAQLENAWTDWAGPNSKSCDYMGRSTMFGLQRLTFRTLVASGEALIVKRRASSSAGLPVPIQIQVLEPDYIDTHREYFAKGENRIIQGIEYDQEGRRVAYWLFPEHPGETGLNRVRLGLISQRVPADEIVHVFREDRAGQVRGVPWGHAVLIRLKDLDEFDDATLMRNKVGACFAGFIKDINAADLVNGDEKKREINKNIEPATMEVLPPGRDITFANPPGAPNHGEYTADVKQGIAAGFGISYESLTGDYSKVNFSSGRMGHLEMHRNIHYWRWNLFIPQFCEPVFQWFLEALILSKGSRFQGANADYTAPSVEMIDPVQETKAQYMAIRGGLSSRTEILLERGEDPKKVTDQIAADNAEADKLGLVFDTDPRKTTNGGMLQQEPNADPAEKNSSNEV